MSAIPGGLATDQQPPMTVPLRHFVVAFAFLLAGGGLGLASALGATGGLAGLAHVHLLLVGWVCVTIMGAMTQFVPVWSNVDLHSRRLANAALALVAVGVAGLGWAFWTASGHWIHGFGGFVVLGVYAFVYNLGRTLARADGLDRTEAHFAFALGAFAVVVTLGFVLAMNLSMGILPVAGLTHAQVVGAHATLAVFGVVLATILGALYQLATMFTQTELRGVDHVLRRIEYGYPAGVVVLASGRLVGSRPVATFGAVVLTAGTLAFAGILARKLYETNVDRTPMLTRYAVAAVALAAWSPLALAAWSPLALAAWVDRPLARETLFGVGATTHLLFVGVIGFVLLGSVYHVVPFIVWDHRYSDRLGFEPVPMIDDLYSDRLAAVDGTLVTLGTLAFVVSRAELLPEAVGQAGGALLVAGLVAFTANVVGVVWKHGDVLPARFRSRPENAD